MKVKTTFSSSINWGLVSNNEHAFSTPTPFFMYYIHTQYTKYHTDGQCKRSYDTRVHLLINCLTENQERSVSITTKKRQLGGGESVNAPLYFFAANKTSMALLRQSERPATHMHVKIPRVEIASSRINALKHYQERVR